jgi:hypothetical protein
MEQLDKLSEALRQVQRELQQVKAPWLIGGSCGLLLQGVALNATPRDLDIYTDMPGAEEIHHALSAFSIDEPVEDQSGLYRSVLSHYAISGIKVELVAGFEVAAYDSFYKVEASFLYNKYAPEMIIPSETDPTVDNGAIEIPLKLMPLEHELLFNILRNRPDRYLAIAEVLVCRTIGMSAALLELIERNAISGTVVAKVQQLLRLEKRI